MTLSEVEINTNWRKVASTIYKKPQDSKIFGSVEIDVTELEKYISEKRKKGIKITLTHVMTLVIGRAFRTEVPEMNTYIRRGKVIQREKINATVSVLQKNGQMSSVIIENADELNLEEISIILRRCIQQSRKGNENRTMKNKDFLANLPWPFRTWFFYIYRIVTVNLGLSIPFIRVNSNSFGSYVISNIGSLGLDHGYGALLPSGNISLVLILGSIRKKAVVIDDQVKIRKVLSLSVTLDHRVVDASHGGRLFRFVKFMVKNPDLLEKNQNKKEYQNSGF